MADYASRFAGMKFKVGGRSPAEDAERVRLAREGAGPDCKPIAEQLLAHGFRLMGLHKPHGSDHDAGPERHNELHRVCTDPVPLLRVCLEAASD